MGTRVVRECCQTKQSSSYLNITSDLGHSFEYQDDESILINPVSYKEDSNTKKACVEFGSNYIRLSAAMPLEVPVSFNFECPKPINKLGSDILLVLELSDATVEWLDVMKAALIGIVHTLSPNDRVGILGFNSRVMKLSGLVAGDVSGKLKLERTIRDMKAEGSADLLEAVRLALYLLKGRLFVNNNASVMLFSATPDEFPDSAMERAENCFTEYKDLEYSINCFGLGNFHNSELLNFISLSGIYTYIPHPVSLTKLLASVFPSIQTGKIHNLSLSLSVSSLLPVEISKIFQHPSSLDYGSTLNIIFLLNFGIAHENAKDRVHINAKISHKFDCFECSGSIDVYGPAWNIEEIVPEEGVMIDFFKEKTVQNLLMAMDKDFNVAVKIVEGTIFEGKMSSVGNCEDMTRFLRKIENLKENLMACGRWTEEIRAVIYSFIRSLWGKSLKNIGN